MAIEDHINQLETRHHLLESELNELMNHPGADDASIANLKRQKLQIKDKISRLKNPS